ncbi:MAG: hypothetical protein ACTJG1_12315 [Enterococcus gilvus]
MISYCLEQATGETRAIIEGLYMSKLPKRNLDRMAEDVFLSKRQVIRLRDQFFEVLAEHLGI